MPYADNFGDLGAHTYRDQVLALFGSPALHSLKDVLDPATARNQRGRRSGYPPLLQYAVNATARIYGSQRRALTELGRHGLWEEATRRYVERVKQPITLPQVPPSAAQQDRFVGWLTKTPGLLDRLSAVFTEAAVKQAERLGNFAEGGWPDFTRPDIEHTVLGDGTYLDPYSDVLEFVDPDGVIAYLGSRAKDPARARVQKAFTDPKPDQKTARGINHVTMSTWTQAGWVVLANRQSFSSEVHQAREMISGLHDLLGDRLHTVVWDRVLKGHDLQAPMAHRRLNVITKPVARAETSTRSDGYTAPTLTKEQARALHKVGSPLPLGTSVYPRSTPYDADVTRSAYFHYQTLDDGPCGHDLWVDDGALFAVEENRHGWIVKVQHARLVQAVPVPGKASTTAYTFHLDCEHASGGYHLISEEYEHPSTPPRAGAQRALYHLRPVPRIAANFAAVHGLRNITESYNSWLKGTLGHNQRAMRLDTDQQYLDQICAGTLANALTWHRHQLQRGHVVHAPD